LLQLLPRKRAFIIPILGVSPYFHPSQVKEVKERALELEKDADREREEVDREREEVDREREAANFQKHLAALRIYVKREGHANVPRRHKEGEVWLGIWVGKQRRKHRVGDLPSEHYTILSSFKGWAWKG
jgi:hypothetical protein